MSELDNTQAIIRKFEPFLKDLSIYELTILNQMIVARIRLMHKANTLMSMADFHIGDRVIWNSSDGTVKAGVIFRLNQKTVSVKTGENEYWNVSPQFLRKEI